MSDHLSGTRPSEEDYSQTLRALVVCMTKFGHQAAAKTVLEFARRRLRINRLSRQFEL